MRRRPDTTDTASVSSEDAAPRRAEGLALVLRCERLDAGGVLLPLRGVSRVVVGRGPAGPPRAEQDGVVRWDVPDAKLSSAHAEIVRTASGFRVVDRGSTNGTFVDGERIADALVAPGAIVRMGYGFFMLLDDAAEAREGGEGLSLTTFSGAFERELVRLDKLAASTLPIVLLGETGSGKEVVARAVHARSGRPGAFVAVNCGALPRELVESHLFGHVRGAFSSAVRDEVGFVRAADGGTLFLDEIGDLPLAAQAALLRVMQEGEVTPVGAHRAVRADVRYLAATHRPLEKMAAEGSFRADLYARLSGFVARLPPLRERRADLGNLCAAWIAEGRVANVRIRWDAAARLFDHRFPLNVRELLQTLHASALLAEGGTIRTSDLPEALRSAAPSRALAPEELALRDDLARRLDACGGNVSQVARELGKARQQVQRWIRKYGLSVPES